MNLLIRNYLTIQAFFNYTSQLDGALYKDCIMLHKEMLKNKTSDNFFDEKRENVTSLPLHKWLLISASALIFVVLPLLFIWSSMGMIHTRGYEQDVSYIKVK